MFHNNFLKSQNFLFLLFIVNVEWGLTMFSHDQKFILYENCTVFNNSGVYGGEICGTDGKTYANSLFLDCINYVDKTYIATAHSGSCLPEQEYCDPNLIYSPVCGSDDKTWANIQSLMCYNHKNHANLTIKFQGECSQIDYCYRHGVEEFGLNPVCASNGYTYQNSAQVKCLQKYVNTDLQILHDGGCRVSEVYKIYGENVCHIAKERYEWNPLCAKDGKTYPNPFIFLCTKPQLGVLAIGECNTTALNACIIAHNNTRWINGTFINDDFHQDDYVCGNDGKTYKSVHHLQCQSLRSKYVSLKHSGPCAGPDDNPCGAVSPEGSNFPVCGSNRITYVSIEALFCAQRRAPERKISYLHDGQC